MFIYVHWQSVYVRRCWWGYF